MLAKEDTGSATGLDSWPTTRTITTSSSRIEVDYPGKITLGITSWNI